MNFNTKFLSIVSTSKSDFLVKSLLLSELVSLC